mgnify:CR=1 FL=1
MDKKKIIIIGAGIGGLTAAHELIKRGHVFLSDTDTEVLIHLIEDIQQKENSRLGEAIRVALNQVVGAYAIVILSKNIANPPSKGIP